MTDELIKELITCKKKAISSVKNDLYLDNRSMRNCINLISIDNKYIYRMFMRQSIDFIEDFSVGLIWTNANAYTEVKKEIILIRFQGPHDNKQDIDSDIHHSFHIHEFSVDDFNSKRFISPSNKTIDNNFSSFQQAVLYFIKKCDIIDLDKFINLQNYNYEQLYLT